MKSFIEIAIVVACIHVANCHGFASTSNQPSEDMQFKTGYLGTPITLPDGASDWLISGIDLNIDDLTDDEGIASIVLHESKVEFDEFGDATVIEKGRVQEWKVKLRRTQTPDIPNDTRRLYAIEFDENRWPNQFQFVWSPESVDSCRLMVSDPKKRNFLPVTNGAAKPPAEVVPAKDENAVYLHTDHFLLEPGPFSARGFGHTQLIGSLNGTVTVVHDANSVQFSPFGDIGMSTALAFPAQSLKFTKIPAIDRTGRDRRVYQSSPTNDGHELTLVIDPTMIETQRLIIKKGKEVQHVLTVYDPLERSFRRQRAQLSHVSASERDAILELRQLLGTRLQFEIKNDVVYRVTLSGEPVSKVALDTLQNLTHLKFLALHNCSKLTASDLDGLKSHPAIAQLIFRDTPLSNEGLKAISTLENLLSLQIAYEPEYGPDAKSPNYGLPSEKCTITSDGLKMLSALTKFVGLGLQGLTFDDDDLPSLNEFQALKTVSFHRTTVTVAGIIDWSRNARVNNLRAFVPAVNADRESVEIEIDCAKLQVSLGGDFDDEMLNRFEGRQDIMGVRLEGSKFVTNEGLKKVLAMDWLENLSICSCTAVTDEALIDISKMSQLESLSLRHCRNITDEGSRRLYTLEKLKSLNLWGTGVTKDGFHAVQANLPQCKVESQSP